MEPMQAALLDQLKDSLIPVAFLVGTLFLLGAVAKTRPASRAFWLIILPIPFLLLAFWWPWMALVFAVYNPLLMLVLLVDAFLLTPAARQLDLSRTVAQKLSIGQDNPVTVTVFNKSNQALQMMMRDDVPADLPVSHTPDAWQTLVQLPPYAHLSLSYAVNPVQRGLYRFEKIHVRYRSRLGLLWFIMQGGRPDEVKVVPDMRRIRRMRVQASKALSAGELYKRTLGLEGTQFSGLRHYFAGDDIRKMAWQATAKLEQPVVRTYEPEVEQPILVLLDAGRKMEGCIRRLQKYDWALTAALAFMGVALDRGDCVGAGVFHNRILASVPLGLGKSHINRLLEALGQTETQSIEPDYETVMLQFARGLKRRSLVVVFTDLIDPIASRSLLRSLESFTAANHQLMVVTFAEREVAEQANAMPQNVEDTYRKGVAADLLAQRRQALAELSRSRKAIVIEAAPETLDEALIQQYLKLKQRSRL